MAVDREYLHALQKIGTELQKIREIMEIEQIEDKEEEKEDNVGTYKYYMRRILDPKKGDIVFKLSGDGNIIFPCKIIDGCYQDPEFHRVSNFWYWENILTGKTENGYACFYKYLGGQI